LTSIENIRNGINLSEAIKLLNALQSVGTDKLLAVLSEDDVGVAKDATLNKLVNALQSVATDKLLVDISQDDVGLAKDATLTDLFSPVSNSGSVSATANTEGLTVSLDKGGRPFVNVYYNVGGACTIYVEISRDNNTWRPLDTITTTASKESVEPYPWITYPYIRVRTPTTNISVEFEIVASR